MSIPLLLILLIAAHYLLDYPLQGPFIAEAKSPFKPLPGVPWYQVMTAHAFLHGAAVAALTGIWWLLFPELIIHFVTDVYKCKGKLTFNQDQAIHLTCKVVWWIIAIEVVVP